MGDPVGLSLALLGLAEPAYNTVRGLWSAYQTTKNFGKDFTVSVNALHLEEFGFSRLLDQFRRHLRNNGPEWSREQHYHKALIKRHIISMIGTFEECHGLARKYERKATQQITETTSTRLQSPGHRDSPDHRATDNSRVNLRGRLRSFRGKKVVDMSKLGGLIQKYLGSESTARPPRQQAMSVNGGHISPTLASEDPSILAPQQQPQGNSLNGAAQNPTGGQVRSDAACPTLSLKEARNQKMVDAQGISIYKKIVWADHGKDDFEERLKTISRMKTQLAELLPTMTYSDRLHVLAGVLGPPRIARGSGVVRQALEGLHGAISYANTSDNGTSLGFAVQLEDNHEDSRLWMEDRGLLDKLKQDSSCVFIGLMTDTSLPEFLVGGTVLEGERPKIDDLPKWFQQLPQSETRHTERPPPFQDIGNITFGTNRIFNLRRVTAKEGSVVKMEQLEDVLEDIRKLPPKERVQLAARIALAHTHFSSVNLGPYPRQLSSYRYFHQEYHYPRNSQDQPELIPPFYRTPWLSHKFGTPAAARRSGGLVHRTVADREKINHA
ncbi:hypothetical protein M426DRAFT_220170 [Hypoxylon sp. CI-4A]|nr:hypothetical protein M426DRAFT_220170 [Hypoxylon sp. CI-4A]